MISRTTIGPEGFWTPRRLGQFDNASFMKRIRGPSNWVIWAALAGAVISWLAFALAMPSVRSCDQLCRKCPEHAVCTGANATCLKLLVMTEGFCALPGTLEHEALLLLPAVRSLPRSARMPVELAKAQAVPESVARKAITYADQKPLLRRHEIARWAAMCCAVVSTAALLCFVCARVRASGDRKRTQLVVKYGNGTKNTPLDRKHV
jgi:hypothetical protein